MSENFTFDYNEAFSRNIGWITEVEQQTLRNKRIAIAGMGGVGGSHLLTLTRLGISNFNIADFDIFELANFNRQVGATIPHIDQEKSDTMARIAHGINPELDIKQFKQGVNENNLDEFLQGVDLYIDGLDFFVLDIRQKVFARCYELGIPCITAAPLGMGVALLTFMPDKMSFEQYFRLQGYEPLEQQIRFLVGLSPSFLHQPYLVDKSRVDFLDKKGPSTPMACELCAGATGAEALKILLNRGKIQCTPWGYQFDAFRNKFKKTWRPWGNNNFIQRVAIYIARKIILGNK
jgi:molybdopterin/thiamine biosynthesis adenylyltransferase